MAIEKPDSAGKNDPSSGVFRRSGDLIESVKTGIYITDTSGKITYVNQAFAELLGFEEKEELLGLNLAQKLYANPHERETFLKKIQEKGYVLDFEIKNIRKDGKEIILSATSNYIRDDKGIVIGVEGVVEDITDRKRLEENLKTEKSRLEQILNADEKITPLLAQDRLIDLVISEVSEILCAEKCSIMFIDEDTHELVIKGAKGLNEEHAREGRVKLGGSIAGIAAKEGKPILVKDIDTSHFKSKKRSHYRTKSFISAPIKVNNRIIGVINVADKRSQEEDFFTVLDLKILSAIVRQTAVAMENADLYRELDYLSIFDPLTKVYNHRYFVKYLNQEISRARRYSNALSLILIDIDNFRQYNDTFGKIAGDEALKGIAMFLKDHLREIDVVCRYAADQFAIILPETKVIQSQIVAEKIRKALESLETKTRLSFSIGTCSYATGMDRYEFILKVEQALLQAKKEPNQKVVSFK